MATAPTQIRIDTEVKKEASELFHKLGIDMSSAINMFLSQCIMRGGIPFNIELPKFNQNTLEAMKEAKLIVKDPSVKGFSSMDELKKSLEN